MMKKLRLYLGSCLLLIVITICVASCFPHIDITLNNSSNRTLRFYYFGTSYLEDHPDEWNYVLELQPNQKRTIGIAQANGTIEDFYINNDTISYFFIDNDSIDYDNLEREKRSQSKILVRYDLSLDDMKKLKEVIHFPPTSAMRNMKMYPSYEEIIRREEEYNDAR